MQAISRTGYRALLESGVRVFEWNGPMLHAKTAVADARWARVGSTNLEERIVKAAASGMAPGRPRQRIRPQRDPMKRSRRRRQLHLLGVSHAR